MQLIENRNLRFMIIGQFISAIGDQFYLIAIPWLTLQLTGRALVAGSVLAVAGVPRALAMLVGGAASDRFSAKALLIGSNGLQGIFMLMLGVFVLLSGRPLWPIFALAFATGLVDAFGLPAMNTLLPAIVADDQLERGNFYLQGINMLSGAAGPAAAGLLISLASTGASSDGSFEGIGIAFLINAITFWAGISFFLPIQADDNQKLESGGEQSLYDSIPALIQYLRRDVRLMYLLALTLTLGLFLTGTIRVGFALLADTQLSGNVLDLGYMTSAFGTGVLLGMIGRQWLPKPAESIAGLVSLGLFSIVPLGLISLGIIRAIVPILGIILLMGAAVGYIMILLLSWIQRRTPRPLLGKMMAAVFFSTIGLSPISQILMGSLLDINLRATFISVGLLLLAITAITAANRTMWSLESNPPPAEPRPPNQANH